MSLGVRKWIIVVLVLSVFLLGNILLIANWLIDTGVCDGARFIRREFLTGTAITIIITLLILFVNPKQQANRSHAGIVKRCPVCDKTVLGSAAYCSSCGSKV